MWQRCRLSLLPMGYHNPSRVPGSVVHPDLWPSPCATGQHNRRAGEQVKRKPGLRLRRM